MAERIHKPSPHRRDDDPLYDEPGNGFSGNGPRSERAKEVSRSAGSFVDELDKQLAENEELQKNSGSGVLKEAEENSSEFGDQDDSQVAEEKQALGIGEGESGGFFNDDKASTKKKGKLLTRRRAILGGGAGLLVGGGIGALLLLMPTLRLEGYMARINERAFGYAQGAVEQRMGFLLERYITTRVFSSLEACGTKVSLDCAQTYPESGIAGGLFDKWRDARIEEKLFDKYGIQIEKTGNTAPGSDKFVVRDRFGRQIFLNDGEIRRGRWLSNGRGPGSRELGREISRLLKVETRWYQVMERRSIRKALIRKYDVKFWCMLACNQRDRAELKYADAKTNLKHRMTERIVYPFSEKVGLYMDCIISGQAGSGNCSVDSIRERGFENISTQDAESIINEFNDSGGDTDSNRSSRRLSQIIIEKLAQKVLGTTVGKVAASGVPVAGQIYAALSIVDMLDRVDTAVKDNVLGKYAADLSSKQYAEHYTTMRSTSDEIKDGKLSWQETEAVHDMFAGAEESKVFQAMTTGTPPMALWGSNKVHAQAAQGDYKCADGNPIPDDELVCEEKKVARTFAYEDWRDGKYIDSVASALNTYDRCMVPLPGGGGVSPGVEVAGKCVVGVRAKTVVRPVLEGIDWAAGGAVGLALNAVTSIPGIKQVANFARNITGDVFEWAIKPLFERIFPFVVQPDSPGREMFDGVFAGAEVAAREFAAGGYADEGAYGLGSQRLTPEQSAMIMQEHETQAQYEHDRSSFYNRFANIDNPKSFLNTVALSTPSSPDRFITNLATSIPTTFSRLLTGIHLAPAGAQASNPLAESPFGITRYGYPVDDPNLYIDPAELTEERCDEIQKEWEDSAVEDEVTGFIEYTTTNPCLLEMVATEASGAMFTNDDDGGIGSSGNSSGTPGEAIISPEGFTFPLLTTKSAIKTPGMFSNDTTNQGGHPYIAYDIPVDPGTPVAAFIDGEVVSISKDKCPGRLISIYNSASNMTISYLHLSMSNHVADGEQVKAGQKIGVVGTEDEGCGSAHLHIDAVAGRSRPSCSRESCSTANQAKFIDIGAELFEAFQALAD